jgi:hypothetical protein
MLDGKIEIEWQRDVTGYDLLPATRGKPGEGTLIAGSANAERIVPRGGKLIRYRPMTLDRLYTRFASVRTADDLLRFIERFGPLTELGRSRDDGEPVLNALEHAEAFRSFLNYRGDDAALASWAGAEGKRIGRLEVMLVQDAASGALCLEYRPPSLLSALWLQLARKLSGNPPFRECLYCGIWFETGPGTGRRRDAKFCTDDHRVVFNRHKQTKGSARHA